VIYAIANKYNPNIEEINSYNCSSNNNQSPVKFEVAYYYPKPVIYADLSLKYYLLVVN